MEKEGKPMSNNDLISRSALLKELDEYNEFAVFDCEAVKDLIDNAPTVDWEFYYNHGYKQAERDLKRPHGKWILCEDTYFSKCSICGDIWLNEECKNYCSNCGAYMREEASDAVDQ